MTKLLTVMILLPIIGYASTQYEPGLPLTKQQYDDIAAEDAAEGLVMSDSGIQIVSASELTFSPERNQLNQKLKKDLKEMAQNGYVNENSTDAQSLLAMQYPEYLTKSDLKSNLADIKLAFPYKGLSFIQKDNIIGYTGFSGWDDGWLGISTFFKNKDFPVCNYERRNMKLSHGGVRLIAENLHYDVNAKPSQYIVGGNQPTGFSYYISWYDPIYIHNLECASETFKSNGVEKLIELAINIDNIP